MVKLLLIPYQLLWLLVLPFLKQSPRVSLGWEERLVKSAPEGPFDIWMQAASGGESQLACMVIKEIGELLPPETTLRVLLTSGTKQGIESLEKGCSALRNDSLEISVAYFPLDSPHLMKQAFSTYRPKLPVIIETELWPGFLIEATKRRRNVLLINGRMSEKSYRSYKHCGWFFKKYGPSKVWAISLQDAARFKRVVGDEKVSVMNNIKFDRIVFNKAKEQNQENPVEKLLPADTPFVLLGSVRKEEEEQILYVIQQLFIKHPDIIIGLFPKHIERSDHLLELLSSLGIKAQKRSKIHTCQPSGSVIVWDVFGELAGAYGLSQAAFVGGSLSNWGGQNFLEPLVFGLQPIIGPNWKNFAWVGKEVVDCGLVREVQNENQLFEVLCQALEVEQNKTQIQEKAHDFFAPKKGGTRQVAMEIVGMLKGSKGEIYD